jgi:hypothetical protein
MYLRDHRPKAVILQAKQKLNSSSLKKIALVKLSKEYCLAKID